MSVAACLLILGSGLPAPAVEAPPERAGCSIPGRVLPTGDLDGDSDPDLAELAWCDGDLVLRARRGFDGHVNWTMRVAASGGWIEPITFDPASRGVIFAFGNRLRAVRGNGTIAWERTFAYQPMPIATGNFTPGGATDVLVALFTTNWLGSDPTTGFTVIDGDHGSVATTTPWPSRSEVWDVARVLDLSGDGLDDIVTWGRLGDRYFVQATNPIRGLPLWTHWTDREVDTVVDGQDVSGDGRTDVLVEQSGLGFSAGANVYTSLLSGASGSPIWGREGWAIPSGDVDDDNAPDVIVFGARETESRTVVTMEAIRSSGAVMYRREYRIDRPADQTSHIATSTSDVNGDGAMDVLLSGVQLDDDAGQSGTKVISGKNGETLWTLAGDRVETLNASFDGNHVDVFTARYDGDTHFTFIDGAGGTALWSLHKQWGGWNLIALGDVNHDGSDDVALSRSEPGPMALPTDERFDSVLSGRNGSVIWRP